jgi:hypothetical protein
VQEFYMVLEQKVVVFPIDGSGPENIVVVWEECEEDTEEEADGCLTMLVGKP